MKTKRVYGLDLLRIISMFGIIGLHLLNKGGGFDAADSTAKLIIARVIAAVIYSSVNVFAMLTGYLYAQRKSVHSSNLIKLIFTVGFYCAVILAVFAITRPDIFVGYRRLFLFALFPPIAGRYWYITSYVLLFVMIPYINAMIQTLQEFQYRKMLLILFVLLSVVSTFGLNDYFKIDYGYSPVWLIFCYLIGGYIKLHKDHLPKVHIRKWLVTLGLMVLLIVILWSFLGDRIVHNALRIYEYISPFIVIEATLFLLIFSKVTIQNPAIQKLMLSLSNGAFGVYIIHSHILIFDYVLVDALSWTKDLNAFAFTAMFVLGLVGIYGVCWAVDLLRISLFHIFKIDALAEHIGEKADAFLGWRQ